MSNDFMPMSLNGLHAAYSAKTTSPSIADLEKAGINVIEDKNEMGLQFEDFLQLMVQQLQNQTMDNTADTSEMLNQLVQMSTVKMLSTVKDGLEALVNASTLNYATSLVGKTVTVGRRDDEGKLEEVVGTVTGTGTYQGMSVIFVDGKMYALNDIMAIGELPKKPEAPGEGGDENGQKTQSVG